MNILISACLLGVPCRYDNSSKNIINTKELAKKHKLIPVCPEVAGGLPTPRVPSEIKDSRVITKDNRDVTKEFEAGARAALETALKNNCGAAVLKARSPSCGKGEIYDGSFTGRLIQGNGKLAELLIKNGIKVYTENEIDSLL